MAALAYFSFELEGWKNLNSLTKMWKRIYWFMKKKTQYELNSRASREAIVVSKELETEL